MDFNKLWFLWKPTYYRLGTISENATTISVQNFMLVSKSTQFT